MEVKIKVFSRERCLKIANALGYKMETEQRTLYYLPDEIFGDVWTVAYMKEYFVVYDQSTNHLSWHIPPFFVEEVYSICNRKVRGGEP